MLNSPVQNNSYIPAAVYIPADFHQPEVTWNKRYGFYEDAKYTFHPGNAIPVMVNAKEQNLVAKEHNYSLYLDRAMNISDSSQNAVDRLYISQPKNL